MGQGGDGEGFAREVSSTYELLTWVGVSAFSVWKAGPGGNRPQERAVWFVWG